MNHSRTQPQANIGRWIAIGSELPCSVIVLLYIGQMLGKIWWGYQGGIYGAILGVILGFFFGVYSIYLTIGYYEKIEQQEFAKRTYMPSAEEIYEEVDIPEPDEEPESV
jgi:F0F1-type ATP synthase assembly protein I